MRNQFYQDSSTRIADGRKDNAFSGVTVRIGHGRDAKERKRAGQLSRLKFREVGSLKNGVIGEEI